MSATAPSVTWTSTPAGSTPWSSDRTSITSSVRIRKLEQVAWKAIRAECAGRVGSVIELLQGRLSDHVLRVVTDPDRGLFPKPGEITLTCDHHSCCDTR